MYIKKIKTAFTLVELIVVITILVILWAISFIALQWFSADARDSKRLSDIRSLLTKIEVERTKWTQLSSMIDTSYDEDGCTWKWAWTHSTTINTIDVPWTQQWCVNFEVLREDPKSFRDPSWGDYPFAYAEWVTDEWTDNEKEYSFVQMATVSEKGWWTKLIWSYYKMQDWDSSSLFEVCTTGTWDNDVLDDEGELTTCSNTGTLVDGKWPLAYNPGVTVNRPNENTGNWTPSPTILTCTFDALEANWSYNDGIGDNWEFDTCTFGA
jgi:prepilin-type N-terminal cleavage/methylation domain-containing protein